MLNAVILKTYNTNLRTWKHERKVIDEHRSGLDFTHVVIMVRCRNVFTQ